MGKTERKQIVVAGGGPAGLTAAWTAASRGMRPIVLEMDKIVGGHARTEEHNGYRFDIGGHRFFTQDPGIEKIWFHLLGDDFRLVPRLSRIYYNGKFFFYPLRIGNVVSGLGMGQSIRVVLSYLYATAFPRKDESDFESWIINRFGRRLYDTFFKTYTEKVWGIPCHEIRAEWAAQRIKGLSLPSAVRNALLGSKGVKSLIGEFRYPRLGPGMMWERMAGEVEKAGGEVRLRHEVVGFHRRDNRIVGLTVEGPDGREVVEGDHFISSVPLPALFARMDPPPPQEVLQAARGLRFRDFLTVCLVVDTAELFPDNWIYVHDSRVRVGRIQNFKNWSADMVPDANKTSVGLEYFVTVDDDLWSLPDDELLALGARELEALGLARSESVESGEVYRQRGAYPIYDDRYKSLVGTLERYLRGFENFQTVGRNGLHRYNNQDHSMITALLAIDNILGADHDVWRVNADESYHETTRGEGLYSWTDPLAPRR